MKNKIICGDCLEVLKKMESETVDLIYLDPPFSSNKNYTGIWDKTEEELSFDDSHWDEGVKGYIKWLRERVDQCFRVLKPTGSIYLHCDWHASHYIKVMMDEVAQKYGGKFQNEVIWKRSLGHHLGTKKFDELTDKILFYTKSDKYYFTPQYKQLSDEEMKKKFPQIEDGTGRRFQHRPLEQAQNIGSKGEIRIIQRKKIKTNQGWRWSQKTIDDRLKENPYCIYWTKNGRPRYKIYADEYKGSQIGNLWDDINSLSSTDQERLGYPTQKPEKLLERIIKASSNKGDVVLDPFCGCGTTLSVDAQLGRKFVGIDVYRMSIKVMDNRLKKIRNWTESHYLSEKVNIESFEWETVFPTGIDDIKKYDWRNFQDWVCEKFGATKGKRGADGGIDGATTTNVAIHDIIEKRLIALPPETLIQSKHFRTTKIGEPHLKKFESTIRHNNKKEGIIVAWGFAKTIKQYVSKAKEKGISIYCVEAEWLYKQPTPKSPYTHSYKVGRRKRINDYLD